MITPKKMKNKIISVIVVSLFALTACAMNPPPAPRPFILEWTQSDTNGTQGYVLLTNSAPMVVINGATNTNYVVTNQIAYGSQFSVMATNFDDASSSEISNTVTNKVLNRPWTLQKR